VIAIRPILYEDINGSTAIDVSAALAVEASRLAEKYGKEAFGCDDLAGILGIGRNNALDLMRRPDFPTKTIGRRRLVSPLGLAAWLVRVNG
jgi:hypothetical protein